MSKPPSIASSPSKGPQIPERTSSLVTAKNRRKVSETESLRLKASLSSLRQRIQRKMPEESEDLEIQEAVLAIELSKKNRETIRIEREIAQEERRVGTLSQDAFNKIILDLNRRNIGQGNDLAIAGAKKRRLGEAGTVQLLQPEDSSDIAENLLLLYNKDGLGQVKRDRNLRRTAFRYYDVENSDPTEGTVWCHVTAMFWPKDYIKTAHIVPHFLGGSTSVDKVFGSEGVSLEVAQNTLILNRTIKGWFDQYNLVILPADTVRNYERVQRWKTELVNDDKMTPFLGERNGKSIHGRDIHGQELIFRNDNRPSARFLYFHFIMALLRIKDLQRTGWEETWAKYHQQRPFPTPGPYMRRAMLGALATYHGVVDFPVVESWMKDHGLDTIVLARDPGQIDIAAQDVIGTVERAIQQAEDKEEYDDTTDEESSEDSEEDNE